MSEGRQRYEMMMQANSEGDERKSSGKIFDEFI